MLATRPSTSRSRRAAPTSTGSARRSTGRPRRRSRPGSSGSSTSSVAAGAREHPLPPIDEVRPAAPTLTVAAPTTDPHPHRVIVDPVWGFRRLEPPPTSPELDTFYESRYRDLLDDGGRAPDLARLVAGGPDAAIEREWQAAT